MEGSVLHGIWYYVWATILFLFQVGGLFLAARVVLGSRSTEGTIAWVLSLVLFPLVSVPIYLIFGRNRLSSYIRARRKVDEEFASSHPLEGRGKQDQTPEEEALSSQWGILENLSKMTLSSENAVQFYFNGQDTYESMLRGMEEAREYIIFQVFIFRHDAQGLRFLDVIRRKAREGVKVYFLVDAIGSNKLRSAFFRKLKKAGVETGIFLPGRTFRGRLRLNFRNHRKIIVVDGKEAWVGGHNIGIEYVGKSPRFGPWRDTHVHVSGPVVDAIQLAFLEDWYWVTRSMPPLNWEVAPRNAGPVRALCLATGPTDPDDTCTLAFVHMINHARKRLWIHSPYFVPAEEVLVALQLATLRGVDVRVLMPAKMDHRLVWLGSFYYSSIPQLDKVRFFRYQPGFLHSKMMLVDDDLLAVGTVNFDNRSFRINFEITLILEDPEVIETCHQQMVQDFASAREDPPDPLAERNIFFRLAARAVRLLGPLL